MDIAVIKQNTEGKYELIYEDAAVTSPQNSLSKLLDKASKWFKSQGK